MLAAMARDLSGRRVAVIGAGLAGLMAARELGRRGAEAVVLDARGRVGGRVWTRRDFDDQQHAEAGGDLIDDQQTRLLELARELGLEPVRILRFGFGFHTAAERRYSRQLDGWEKIEKRLRPIIDAYCVSEERWDTALARGLASGSVADWAARARTSSRERRLLVGLRGFFLADPEQLSLLALVDQLASGGNPAETRFYRLRDGNDTLPRALAARVRGRLLLQTTALAIAQTSKGVRLTVADRHGRASELRADYAVVAVPAATLRRIAMRPALPPRQRAAVARLAYGRATRVLAQFDRRVWRRPTRPRAFGTDTSIGAVWEGNEQQPGPAGILSFLAGGSASESLQRIAARGASALAREIAWLANGRLVPRAMRTIVWEDDPWARGGYAVFEAGYDPELRAWLARPHGRVVFAGEHTSIRWQGYMNGAIESGLRAAAEVAIIADCGL
jgi:monoamine oxidase